MNRNDHLPPPDTPLYHTRVQGDEMSVIVVATNFEDPEGSLGQQYARQISANGLHLCLCVVVVGATGGGSCSSGRRR